MPTLPLYDTTAHPDAWHQVIAPGGYERWHFDAGDAVTRLRIHIDFFDGNPFDRAYRRAYRHYRRRPTRVAPPVPREYPCIGVIAFEDDARLWDTNIVFPPGSFRGSRVTPDVSVGSHSLRTRDDGLITVSLDGLAGRGGSTLSGELLFRPTSADAPPWRRLDTSHESVVHFWRPPRTCEVRGTLNITPAGKAARVIAFEGRGGDERQYGTGLLTRDVERRIVPILNY